MTDSLTEYTNEREKEDGNSDEGQPEREGR